jgi:radical SAM superfamily enzyme YgiQ (UPF0313 family)
MRIMLLQPDQEEGLGLQSLMRLEPLGLEMLAGALSPAHQVRVLDLRVEEHTLDVALEDFDPHLVGVTSSFTVGTPQALGVAGHVKTICPKAFTVLGAHHPSLHPEDFRHEAVDAIAVGEGEATVKELADSLATGKDIARVPGLVLNRPGGQSFTGARELLRDLDSLPYPNRSIARHVRSHYHLFRKAPIAAVETSRGCPHQCNFCAVWRFYQETVRFKSPERVVRELEMVEEPNVFFTDDNFLASVSRAREIARLIKERGLHKLYFFQARSDSIVRHPELLSTWREIGLQTVFIGFEKPEQQGLDALNKHNSAHNNEAALDLLRRLGIEPIVSFIVDPDYDREAFATLRAYVHRLRLKRPFFAVLTPLPGTALFDQLKERLNTRDYRLFDLLHAVVPTMLEPGRFYRELAALYRAAYPRWKLTLGQLVLALDDLFSTASRPYSQRAMLTGMRRLSQPEAYGR